MRITENFTWEELTFSQTALRNNIANTPTEQARINIGWVCSKILEPIHYYLGQIHLTSAYRSEALNTAIGGSQTSQHCSGQAVDIVVPGIKISRLFEWIIASDLPYDQVIEEFGRWVHISYSRERRRKQKLIARIENGQASYILV